MFQTKTKLCIIKLPDFYEEYTFVQRVLEWKKNFIPFLFDCFGNIHEYYNSYYILCLKLNFNQVNISFFKRFFFMHSLYTVIDPVCSLTRTHLFLMIEFMDTLLFVMSHYKNIFVTSIIHYIWKDNDFPSVILYL